MATPDFGIQLKGLTEALMLLKKMARDSTAVMPRTMRRISFLAGDASKDRAPISPDVGTIRKGTGRPMKIMKDRGTSRPTPGGLVNSIDWESNAEEAIIFVASNAAAGKYASIIHDEKGTTWHNRGLGTIAKGALADDKFIIRGIGDTAGSAFAVITDEQSKVLAGV